MDNQNPSSAVEILALAPIRTNARGQSDLQTISSSAQDRPDLEHQDVVQISCSGGEQGSLIKCTRVLAKAMTHMVVRFSDAALAHNGPNLNVVRTREPCQSRLFSNSFFQTEHRFLGAANSTDECM